MNDETTTLAQLRGVIAEFVAERDWEIFHDAKNLSMSIAIEAAELMEHFQWVRNEELPKFTTEPNVRARIVDEVADILCFVLALSNVLGLDLATAVTDKMAKNVAKYPAETFRGRYFKPGRDEPRREA